MKADGGSATALTLDVTDRVELAGAVDGVVAEQGTPDVLVKPVALRRKRTFMRREDERGWADAASGVHGVR
jgi:NADP-dependent 3-hydroxy acid dehydrogenase YdfG